MSKGWMPLGANEHGVEMWEEAAQKQTIREYDHVIPCKPGKTPETIKRKVVSSLSLPCTTAQAVFKQRQRDTKVA